MSFIFLLFVEAVACMYLRTHLPRKKYYQGYPKPLRNSQILSSDNNNILVLVEFHESLQLYSAGVEYFVKLRDCTLSPPFLSPFLDSVVSYVLSLRTAFLTCPPSHTFVPLAIMSASPPQEDPAEKYEREDTVENDQPSTNKPEGKPVLAYRSLLIPVRRVDPKIYPLSRATRASQEESWPPKGQ